MNFEQYQAAWTPAPSGTPHGSEVETLIHNLTRSERRSRILLSTCAVNASLAMVFTLWVVFFRRPLAWNEIFVAIALQVPVTWVLIALLRRQELRRRAFRLSGIAVLDAAQASLANVRSRIQDVRLMATFACAIVPLLALAVHQLQASGKMNSQAALGFAIVCTVVLGVNVFVQWLRYRRTLAPQRARLEKILASLQDEA